VNECGDPTIPLSGWTGLAAIPRVIIPGVGVFDRDSYGIAVAAAGGKLYAIGGQDEHTNTGRADVYNPDTDSWMPAANMLQGSRYRPGAYGYNGQVYVFGGWNRAAGAGARKTGEKFDPSTGNWTTVAQMITARQGFATGVLDGMLYAAGGTSQFCEGYREGYCSRVHTAERYDPSINAWQSIAALPDDHYSCSAGGVINGKWYVSSCYYGSNWAISRSAFVFDPNTGAWSAIASLPAPCRQAQAAVVDNRMFMYGDSQDDAPLSPHRTLVYDPESDSWTQVSNPEDPGTATEPKAGFHPGFASLDEKLYLAGGRATDRLEVLGCPPAQGRS
jgi:N-acetylneuraminic acid mutarotase